MLFGRFLGVCRDFGSVVISPCHSHIIRSRSTALYFSISALHILPLPLFICFSATKNIVGYIEVPLSGFKMITPSFKNTTEAEYPIDKFEVKGSGDGVTTMQVLNSAGQVAGLYYWYNEFQDGDTLYPAGWFDVSGSTPAAIRSLKPNEAVFFNTDETGVTVLSAGEVPGAQTHTVEGFAMLGNGSPVTIDVDQMTVNGSGDGVTTIQQLNAAGQVAGMYYWYNEFQDGDTLYPAGWFDVSGSTPAGISLNPGDAVLFNTDETGVSMTIPAAIQ